MKMGKKIWVMLSAVILVVIGVHLTSEVSADEKEIEYGDVTVKVEWVGGEQYYADIYLENVSGGDDTLYDAVLHSEKDVPWEHTFKDIPVKIDGKEVEYEIKEADEVGGFTPTVEGNVKDGYVVTFTYDGGSGSQGNYIEVMQMRLDGKELVNLTGSLYENGVKTDSFTMNEGNYFTHYFEGKDVYDANGNEIEYEIKVDPVNGLEYEVEYEGGGQYIVVVSVEGAPEVCRYLTFTALDKDKKKVQDADIVIEDKEGNLIHAGATEEDGEVVFENELENGVTYNYTVSAEGYEDVTGEIVGGSFGCEKTFTIGNVLEDEVVEEDEVSNGEGAKVEDTKHCKGYEIKVNGKGVGGVTVVVKDEEGKEVTKGKTDKNGVYKVGKEVEDGTLYTIEASKKGYKDVKTEDRVGVGDCKIELTIEELEEEEGKGTEGKEDTAGGKGTSGTEGTADDGGTEGTVGGEAGKDSTEGETSQDEGKEDEEEGARLADTATNIFNLILGGLVMVIVGGLGAYFVNKRKNQVE